MPRDVLSISVDDLIYVETIRTLFGVELQTPNMDRLAAMGVSFSNAFCSTALCNPSRTSILTGQSPFTTGVHDNRDDWTTSVDPAEMLPSFFRQAGYDVQAFGKVFHRLPPATSLQLFDAFSDHSGVTRDTLNIQDAVTALTARNDADPLLLMVGLNDPHVPLISPPRFTDRYPLDKIVLPDGAEYRDMPEFVRSFIRQNAVNNMSPHEVKAFIQGYLANITEMDARLGKLLDAVEAEPDYDPIIALWSDHGYSLGDVDHDHQGRFTLWDETGRTPLIIVDPEAPKASRGEIYDGVVSTLALAPTLLTLAGVPVPASMQGRPLTNILADPSTVREGVALTTMFGSVSIRTNDWRYTRYEDGSEELFHVSKDPENVVNLAGDPAYVAVQGKMQDALIAELAEVGAAIDEDRNIVSVNAGAGDSTYFLTAVSDLDRFTDRSGIDELYVGMERFTMPDWAENLTTAGFGKTTGSYKLDFHIRGNQEANFVVGYEESDRLMGMRGSDTLDGASDDDHLYGGRGKDHLLGDQGSDRLTGRDGTDHLIGGSGQDTLSGSYGRDTLTGDRDSDVFTIKARSQAVTRITDFDSEVDQLVLRGPEWADATVNHRDAATVIDAGSQRVVLEGVTENDLSGYDLLG